LRVCSRMAADAGGDDFVGLAGGEDDDAVGAFEVLEGAADGVGEVGAGGVVALDEVDDDFAVGLGFEDGAFGPELFAQLEEVLDDAVVDDDDFAGHAHVGVGVAGVGLAVGGPAGVADAEPAVDGFFVNEGGEAGEFAGVAPDLDGAVFQHCEAGGVIAAVLEALEAVQDDRGRVTRPDIANDSTHGDPSKSVDKVCAGKGFLWGVEYLAPVGAPFHNTHKNLTRTRDRRGASPR
jgi:hypothetical protein